MNFQDALLLLPGLIIGLTVHEAAHAISAKWLGDRTSEKMGRISLNPLRHLSIYGTLALFFLGFGWGKPVIVNLYNFKKPKFYYLLSSLAGPASNLIICGICLGILYMYPPRMVYNFLIGVFLINGMLAAINLVPVPPLDGSKIWPCLIPGMKPTVSGKWSMIWIVVLIVGLKTGGISKILGPVQDGMWSLLPDYKKIIEQKNAPRPEGFPEALDPAEGAMAIGYYTYPFDSEDPNAFCLGYTLKNQNPENDVLGVIRQGLVGNGWVKLRYDLYEPENEFTEQWELDEKTESFWNSRMVEFWANKNGDVMEVRFEKNIKAESKDWVRCNQFFYTINTYPSEYLEEYKQLHPQEFGVP